MYCTELLDRRRYNSRNFIHIIAKNPFFNIPTIKEAQKGNKRWVKNENTQTNQSLMNHFNNELFSWSAGIPLHLVVSILAKLLCEYGHHFELKLVFSKLCIYFGMGCF